jgi:hypothetical protein
MNLKRRLLSKQLAAFLTIGLLILVVGVIITNDAIDLISSPKLTVPGHHFDALELGGALEKQVKHWQDSLFLEAYAATYRIADDNVPASVLTDKAYFRFVGWRSDWWGKLISHYNANHLIVDVTIDMEDRELVELSYSHGEPFGFDASLQVTQWPYDEKKLIQICDDFGGMEFRQAHEVHLAHVHASSTRAGRFWTVEYNRVPEYFTCTTNLDTGEILTQREGAAWQTVGNLSQME